MTSPYQSATFGSIARSISATHRTRSGSLIFLNTSDIDRGRILHRRYMPVEKMPGQAKKSVLPGDILFSEIRPANGRWALVSEPSDDFIVSTKLMVIRADPDLVVPEYLYIFLTSTQTTRWLQTLAESRSGTFPQITFDQVSALRVPLPSLEVQSAIAATIGALDDKIDSNLRLIALIPELVRAKVAAVTSAGGVKVPVASLAQFVNGGAFTKGASGTGRMVLRIAELNSGPGGSTVYSDIDVPETKTARAGDILMSWSGSLGIYRWFRNEGIINQHIFKVIPTGYPSWLVFERLESVMAVFRGIAHDKATTMGHIQRGHLESITVVLPLPEEIERLDSCLSPLWDRLLLAERENLGLQRLRDALLPELVSGRIRINEVSS